MTVGLVVMTVAGCRAKAPASTPEPPFVMVTATPAAPEPVATRCLWPSAIRCVHSVTREEALDALRIADVARAAQKPAPPPRPEATVSKSELRRREVQSLRPRAALVEEEEALEALRRYVGCHPGDLEIAFELARRNVELNRFETAAYLFFRVADGPADDDRTAEAFLRGLEAINVLATHRGLTECFDVLDEKVPSQAARLCSLPIVMAHPARSPACTSINMVDVDIQRLSLQRGGVSGTETK